MLLIIITIIPCILSCLYIQQIYKHDLWLSSLVDKIRRYRHRRWFLLSALFKGCSQNSASITVTTCQNVSPSSSPCSRKKIELQEKEHTKMNQSRDVSKKNTASMKELTGSNTGKGLFGDSKTQTMTELRKKILIFREKLDLPPCSSSDTVLQLVIVSVKDLHNLYPDVVPRNSMSETKGTSMNQALNAFCNAMSAMGDMWTHSNKWIIRHSLLNADMEQLALSMLDDMIKVAKEKMSNMMDDDEDEEMNDNITVDNVTEKSSPESPTDKKSQHPESPRTPTSVLPPTRAPYSPPRLLPLRVQAVGKLNQIDLKRLVFHFPQDASKNFHPLNGMYKKVEEVKAETEAKKDFEGDTIEVDNDDILKDNNQKITEDKPDKFVCDNEKIVVRSSGIKQMSEPERSIESNSRIQSVLSSESSAKSSSNNQSMSSPKSLAKRSLGIQPTSAETPVRSIQPMSSSESSAGTTLTGVHLETQIPSLSKPVASPSEPSSSCKEQVNSAAESTEVQPPPPPQTPVTTEHVAPQPTSSKAPNITSAQLTPTGSAARPSTPPPPPPPPPPLMEKMATPPPRPMPLSSRGSVPPPPPPPPPVMGSIATPPPPPMPLSSKGSAPPPPPPPPLMGSIATPPPPPTPLSSRGSAPPSPPVTAVTNGAGPPPPPGGAKCLRPKKANTKLKRSSQIANLYRQLKGKVEGSSLKGKQSQGRTGKSGSSGENQGKGMADALAEMTKRSSYFQQIEEDVKNHSESIKEVKKALSSFQATDMNELLKFHKYVESHLEKLTDESQVLARFEDFPTKKLEAVRMAASLYSKLEAITTTLQNLKIVSPLNQLLDKVENYFTKIKGEIDTLERTKDEESKKFQSHKIQFDFGIIVRIKELMVDVSANCMELALTERREAKAKQTEECKSKPEGKNMVSAKMLWRAFQFAFRVYTFAGGHDDRADKLTRELAYEIETDPQP